MKFNLKKVNDTQELPLNAAVESESEEEKSMNNSRSRSRSLSPEGKSK